MRRPPRRQLAHDRNYFGAEPITPSSLHCPVCEHVTEVLPHLQRHIASHFYTAPALLFLDDGDDRGIVGNPLAAAARRTGWRRRRPPRPPPSTERGPRARQRRRARPPRSNAARRRRTTSAQRASPRRSTGSGRQPPHVGLAMIEALLAADAMPFASSAALRVILEELNKSGL